VANDLNTVLDDAGNRALVEKYLEQKFLERRDYETKLANSELGQRFKLPEKAGQYVEATRKGRFRRPQNLDSAAPTSDPASGATMGTEKIKFPIEFIQEFVPVGATAQLTSWIDLEEWANEDLPMALRRRMHELTQNAFYVGRMTPGKWAANGTEDTAFDASAQATVTLYGVSFTFPSAPRYYASGKTALAALNEGDRANFADLESIKNRLVLAGAQKIGGTLRCLLSDSMASDLAKDDKYFAAMVNAFKGEGLKTGKLGDFRGLSFEIDDEPFTFDWGTDNKRAVAGPLHGAIITGKGAFAYLDLGGRSNARPKFKVQDVSKTGVEKTIGYLVPFQAAIANADYCATYVAPVSDYQANNA